jgi:hypothetical protein
MIIPHFFTDAEETKILRSLCFHLNKSYNTDYVVGVKNKLESKKYKSITVNFTKKIQKVTWTISYPYWAVKYPSLLDTDKKREKFDCTYVDPTVERSLLALVQVMKPIKTGGPFVIVLKHLLRSETVLDCLSAPPSFQQEMRQSLIKSTIAKKFSLNERELSNVNFFQE